MITPFKISKFTFDICFTTPPFFFFFFKCAVGYASGSSDQCGHHCCSRQYNHGETGECRGGKENAQVSERTITRRLYSRNFAIERYNPVLIALAYSLPLLDGNNQLHEHSFVEQTSVVFADLTDACIDAYVKTGTPMYDQSPFLFICSWPCYLKLFYQG